MTDTEGTTEAPAAPVWPTVTIVGAGGVEEVLDVPKAGSHARELFDYHTRVVRDWVIVKGEVPRDDLDDDGVPKHPTEADGVAVWRAYAVEVGGIDPKDAKKMPKPTLMELFPVPEDLDEDDDEIARLEKGEVS